MNLGTPRAEEDGMAFGPIDRFASHMEGKWHGSLVNRGVAAASRLITAALLACRLIRGSHTTFHLSDLRSLSPVAPSPFPHLLAAAQRRPHCTLQTTFPPRPLLLRIVPPNADFHVADDNPWHLQAHCAGWHDVGWVR
jgi:hypothetical protein